MNLSCEGFLEELASKAAAPGGGGASALVGAAGVALGSMVGSLTVGKKKYAAVEADIIALNVRAEALRKRLEALVQADAEAFLPVAAAYKLPKETPDLIYLCFPNNPTGAAITKAQLQEWVDYANKVGAVILYDAAYEAYISEPDVPHSIYECEGARTCAIEFRSFSKNAGFTGVRLGFTVIPKDLKSGDVSLHALWARRHGTKYNGAPYIVQRAGEAVYSATGKAQLKEQVAYYMNNAQYILKGLQEAGFTVSGGVNAPYIWLKAPNGMTSWEFFDYLLENVNVVGTPGSGFGPSGEHYFRLTAFGSYENTVEAVDRLKKIQL